MRQLAPLPTHPQRQIKLRAASSLGHSLGYSLGLRRPASALTLNLIPIPTLTRTRAQVGGGAACT